MTQQLCFATFTVVCFSDCAACTNFHTVFSWATAGFIQCHLFSNYNIIRQAIITLIARFSLSLFKHVNSWYNSELFNNV